MKYQVKLSNKIIKQLDKIQFDLYLKIYEKLVSLSENPRPNGCLKLTNSFDYKIRIGSYRILYQIIDHDKIVEVFDVSHRKDAYKKK
jgi:mRNA interferase RelE/StbE